MLLEDRRIATFPIYRILERHWYYRKSMGNKHGLNQTKEDFNISDRNLEDLLPPRRQTSSIYRRERQWLDVNFRWNNCTWKSTWMCIVWSIDCSYSKSLGVSSCSAVVKKTQQLWIVFFEGTVVRSSGCDYMKDRLGKDMITLSQFQW